MNFKIENFFLSVEIPTYPMMIHRKSDDLGRIVDRNLKYVENLEFSRE